MSVWQLYQDAGYEQFPCEVEDKCDNCKKAWLLRQEYYLKGNKMAYLMASHLEGDHCKCESE